MVGLGKPNHIWRKRHNNKGHLWFYRKRYQKVWVRPRSLSQRLEPIIIRACSIFYEEVPVVHVEDARVSEFEEAWPGNPWYFHLAVAVIWAEIVQSGPWTTIIQLQWLIVQRWQRLPKGPARRRNDNKKHIPECLNGTDRAVLTTRSEAEPKDTQVDWLYKRGWEEWQRHFGLADWSHSRRITTKKENARQARADQRYSELW